MSHPQPRIVALGGAGMLAGIWKPLAALLEPSCKALSLPPLLPAIPQMAAWVAAQLNDNPVVLMGHSMGALVAIETALQKPAAALVLLGAAAKMPVHPDLLQQAKEVPDEAAALILKWGVSTHHPAAAEIKAALKEQMQPDALFNDLSACNNYLDGEAAARKISCPVLVMTGVDDKLTKAAAGEALAKLFARGQFHAFPACGHMLMAEQPVETAQKIQNFLQGI